MSFSLSLGTLETLHHGRICNVENQEVRTMMYIVIMISAVRNQKIILLKSFNNIYKLKRWQMLLNPYRFLKNLWRKREQRIPRKVKVRVQLFYHLKLSREAVTFVHIWMAGRGSLAFYLMIRSRFPGSLHQMWAGHLVYKRLVCGRTGECRRVFKGRDCFERENAKSLASACVKERKYLFAVL